MEKEICCVLSVNRSVDSNQLITEWFYINKTFKFRQADVNINAIYMLECKSQNS